MANALQQASIQTEINEKGVAKLKGYFEDFADFLASGKADSKDLGELLPELLYQLGELVGIVDCYVTLVCFMPASSFLFTPPGERGKERRGEISGLAAGKLLCCANFEWCSDNEL